MPPAQAESPGRGARAGAEAEGGQRMLGKNPRERSCPFSSRSCCGDIAGGGKHGPGHLHPGAHHLPAAGGSVHLHHQVGPCRVPPRPPGAAEHPWGSRAPLGVPWEDGVGEHWGLPSKGDRGIAPQVPVLLQPPPAPHVLAPLQPDHGRNGVRQPDL